MLIGSIQVKTTVIDVVMDVDCSTRLFYFYIYIFVRTIKSHKHDDTIDRRGLVPGDREASTTKNRLPGDGMNPGRGLARGRMMDLAVGDFAHPVLDLPGHVDLPRDDGTYPGMNDGLG